MTSMTSILSSKGLGIVEVVFAVVMNITLERSKGIFLFLLFELAFGPLQLASAFFGLSVRFLPEAMNFFPGLRHQILSGLFGLVRGLFEQFFRFRNRTLFMFVQYHFVDQNSGHNTNKTRERTPRCGSRSSAGSATARRRT